MKFPHDYLSETGIPFNSLRLGMPRFFIVGKLIQFT